MIDPISIPSVSVTCAQDGSSTRANSMGMRPMQERCYQKRGEQAFVQDKQTIERGLFDEELVPEELTQARRGKIVKEKFPNLDNENQETVRQHAVAALNLVQQAKKALNEGGSEDLKNTSLIDGVRKFALSVKDLEIDLIDRINPFGEAYAIQDKSMSEERLKQVAEVIAARRVNLTLEEARDLATAKKDPTYLLADVEIVATFKLANINRKRLEALLHKFFGSARLDLELKDRFGEQVEPREWFLVPLPVIEEAIRMLIDGSIGNFRYDPNAARVVEA